MSDSFDLGVFEEAGVYDPDAQNAEDRKALLEYLLSLGVTVEDIISANKPLWSLVQEAMGNERKLYSAEDISRAQGIPLERVIVIYESMGIQISDPNEIRFTDDDLKMLHTLAALSDTLGIDRADFGDLVRIFGMSLAKMADGFVGIYTRGPAQKLNDKNLSDLEKAQISVELMSKANDLGAPEAVAVQLSHHIESSFRRQAEAQISAEKPGQLKMAVGFLDISGYSAMATNTSLEELMDLITFYENQAFRIITRNGGRMVKVIGDEVLFVVNDPHTACQIAADLFSTFSTSAPGIESENIGLHGGLAFGEVIFHRGDYYGQVVNLAARLSEISIKGELLATSNLVDALGDADSFNFLPAGKREVRGFKDFVDVYSLEWAAIKESKARE